MLLLLAASLVAFKLLIGCVFSSWDSVLEALDSDAINNRINLRVYATSRWNQMEERVQEDRLNDRSRPRIGVTEKQQVNKHSLFYNSSFIHNLLTRLHP